MSAFSGSVRAQHTWIASPTATFLVEQNNGQMLQISNSIVNVVGALSSSTFLSPTGTLGELNISGGVAGLGNLYISASYVNTVGWQLSVSGNLAVIGSASFTGPTSTSFSTNAAAAYTAISSSAATQASSSYYATNATLLDNNSGSFYTNASNITAGTLAVAFGGTGDNSLTSGSNLVGNGTSGILASVGSTPQVLVSNAGGTLWTGSYSINRYMTSTQTATNGVPKICTDLQFSINSGEIWCIVYQLSLSVAGSAGQLTLSTQGLGSSTFQIDYVEIGGSTAGATVTFHQSTAPSDTRTYTGNEIVLLRVFVNAGTTGGTIAPEVLWDGNNIGLVLGSTAQAFRIA